MAGIDRELDYNNDSNPWAITASLSTTPIIGCRKSAGGIIYVPAGSGLTSLTFYFAKDKAETFLAANELSSGTQNPRTYVPLVMTVAAANAYPLPDECYGCGAFKIVGNTTGNLDISHKT